VSALGRVPAPHAVAGALCAGLSGSLVVRPGAVALLVGAVASASAAVVARGPARLLALALAFCLAGVWWGSARLEALERSVLVERVGDAAPARVEVTGPARVGSFSVRLPVRVRRFGRLVVDERARLELPRGRAPPQGAVLEVIASVRLPRRAEESADFDEQTYLARQGVHVVLRAHSYRIVGRRGGIGAVADRLRAGVASALARGLQGERRAVVAGVVLGEDEGLEEDLRDAFRASGLYHLLAVSGQNVAYVVFGTLLAAWLVGIPRAAGHLAAVVAVLAYVLAVGWQPSVVRAGVAGTLASLAWLASRPADRWYFLLVGAAVLLAVNPFSLLEPGFQLSFSAVAAIFLLVPRLERRLEGYPVHPKVAAVVIVSAACGVATAPVLWLHFGAVPVYSVPANALAAPVVAPLLGGGLACAALAPVAPSAAAGLAWATGWLGAYLAWCARATGGLPYAQVTSGKALLAAAGAAVFGAVALRIRRRRAPRVLALAGMVAALVAGWGGWSGASDERVPPTGLRVTFLDVGQGDATLVEVPEGAILVDQGPPEANVADRLDELGVERVAALVLTHPQRDHVGGAEEVLETAAVDLVLDPALPVEVPETRAALAAARRRDVRVAVARTGQVFRLGALRLEILWPDGPGLASADPNDRAIVILATYGETDVLLPADAESHVTLPLRPPPVEVLKVAHHGSADDALPRLLERTRPRIAVISSGRGNSYGHPAPSTLAALAEAPALAVYRTDRDGQVTVESDGKRLTVVEER
jgi:competence protein ComEC